MAKSGILKQYKFQGKYLNEAQKAYNKAVDRAWRRIKYMKKKYGIEASLPQLPGTTYTPEVEKATRRIEEIRTDIYANPTKKGEFIDKAIQDFIDDIYDYLSYVDTSSVYPSVWNHNANRAKRWRDLAVNAVKQHRSMMGDVEFYKAIIQSDKASNLKAIAQSIYALPSDDKAESASTALFAEFIHELTGEPLSQEQIESFGNYDNEEIDNYTEISDIDSWEMRGFGEDFEDDI